MLRLSGWTVGYVIANQIALLVVTVLANGTDGGPFIYISAYAFFQLPHGLFAVSLMTTFTPEMATSRRADDLAALRAQLSRGHPARRDRDRARRRAVPRPGAPDRRRAAATRCVLRRRRVGGRRHARRVRRRPAAVLHLPVRVARVLRRATTRSRRSGSTASRTSVNIVAGVPALRVAGHPRASRSRSRSPTSSAPALTLVVLHARLGGIDGRADGRRPSRKVVVAAAAVAGGELGRRASAIGWSSTGRGDRSPSCSARSAGGARLPRAPGAAAGRGARPRSPRCVPRGAGRRPRV